MRRGLTLIEVLVALVLFQFGMLVLVGASVVAARELAEAHRKTRARTMARNRVELLRANGCPATASGTQHTASGLTEHWRVDGTALHREISSSVVFDLPGKRRDSVVLRSATVCAG